MNARTDDSALDAEQLVTRFLPFNTPMAHIATALTQNFGMKGTFGAGPISQFV